MASLFVASCFSEEVRPPPSLKFAKSSSTTNKNKQKMPRYGLELLIILQRGTCEEGASGATDGRLVVAICWGFSRNLVLYFQLNLGCYQRYRTTNCHCYQLSHKHQLINQCSHVHDTHFTFIMSPNPILMVLLTNLENRTVFIASNVLSGRKKPNKW